MSITVPLEGFGGGVGVSIKKVWENASPGSTFGPQSITIDFSQYEYALILAYDEIDGNLISATCKKNHGTRISLSRSLQISGNTALGIQRQATLEDSQIAFLNCTTVSTSGVTYVNDYMIPAYIYGVKGVSE